MLNENQVNHVLVDAIWRCPRPFPTWLLLKSRISYVEIMHRGEFLQAFSAFVSVAITVSAHSGFPIFVVVANFSVLVSCQDDDIFPVCL